MRKQVGTGNHRKLFLALGLRRPGEWVGARRVGRDHSELVLGPKNERRVRQEGSAVSGN